MLMALDVLRSLRSLADCLGRSSQDAGGKLHGHAMQAAVLPDQRSAWDLHYFAAGMSEPDGFGSGVIGDVTVGRHQHGAVGDQIVCVRRGEAAAFIDES